MGEFASRNEMARQSEEMDYFEKILSPSEVEDRLKVLELTQLFSVYCSVLEADLGGTRQTVQVAEIDALSEELTGSQPSEIATYYPKEFPYVIRKEGYRETSKTEGVQLTSCFAVMNKNKIFYFDSENTAHLLTSEGDQWKDEVQDLGLFTGKIISVQALSDRELLTVDEHGLVINWKHHYDKWRSFSVPQASEGAVMCVALPDSQYLQTRRENLYLNNQLVGEHDNRPNRVQALLEGRIVSRDQNQDFYVWKKDDDGKWQGKIIHNSGGEYFDDWPIQAFSDGRIYFLDDNNEISLLEENKDDSWAAKKIVRRWGGGFQDFRVLPDGRIITVSNATLIWRKNEEGNYEAEQIGGPADYLEVLPTGQILTSGNDWQFRVYDGTPIEEENG